MARDHRRLRVFHLSHELILAVYRETTCFPRDEWFGLRAQIRRASVSVACNIVEGNARHSCAEYVHFLNIARSSAAEVEYLIGLAAQLGYLQDVTAVAMQKSCNDLIPQLEMLIRRMRAARTTRD